MGKKQAINRVFYLNFFLFERISTKVEDTQSVNTVKSAEEGIFVNSLRSLFPSIEIKVEHVSFFLFLYNLFFKISYRVEYLSDMIHYHMACQCVLVQ
jgi:hypothetical protein